MNSGEESGPIYDIFSKKLSELKGNKEEIQVKSILDGKGSLLFNVLSKEECKLLIDTCEQLGFDVKSSGERFCHRSVHYDVPFANWLWKRVSPYCPPLYEEADDDKGNSSHPFLFVFL
jgi:hypothetical protein